MIDALIQSAVLFALVGIATLFLRRRSPASLRHMLWAFAIVGALAAPLIARLSPLELHVVPAVPATASGPSGARSSGDATTFPSPPGGGDASDQQDVIDEAAPAVTSPVQSERRIAWAALIAIGWGAGVIVLLARMAYGLITVHRIAAGGEEITDPAWLLGSGAGTSISTSRTMATRNPRASVANSGG